MSSNGSNDAQVARIDSLFGSQGNTRNFTSLLNPSYLQASNGKESHKRETDAEREERKAKRRRSRWGGDEKEKTFIPGMPTVLPTNLSKEQEEAYLVQLQIEEISRKLRTGELGIPLNPEERSPSPEPIYSSDGKRLNTREYRTRKRLEEERHHLIQQMLSLNPDFKPPADYKPPIIRVSDKVMIPQDDHPDINFVGLLIGPRGNTLKSMERDTGAKIIIRGKGSVKEGKVGRKDGQPLPGEDEPLHAYVTANNPEAVKKAVDRIKEIIRQGVEVPEGQNDLRRMQLRELALLNGTLRENEGPRCSNCGASDHKSWMCPDKPNVTNNIVCSSCGGAGHIARDCRQKRPGAGGPNAAGDKNKIDEEYLSLMAELGEGPPPNRDNDRDSGQNRFGRRSGSSGNMGLFDRQMAPRAIMAPPPRLEHNMMPTPPQLIPNTLPPPPWSPVMPPANKPPGSDMIPNMNHPPPPSAPSLAMPPPWQTPSIPPPNLLQAPPPPPPTSQPPPVTTSQAAIPPLLPWLQTQTQPPPPGSQPTPQQPQQPQPAQQQQQGQQQTPHATLPPPGLPPWQQPPPPLSATAPGPVPPPNRAPPPNMFPWHQNFIGVPPPQPVQPPPPPGHNGQGVDINALAGLPSLLAAPPPPPPS
ncbi:splicing factor 1-like [Zootermopsis nevadensis]|uniref:Branchpoint-bridging protein n=1 Tax=Zootermopsis nevadensis TaxID=136037 RepID=A0A067R957_ZOONE|nr:splicing factor 1-like [Zootermopsis nevadensis]KDR15002.1 Splicing factor 1 [Zootermopsis nevadensis]